MQTSNLPSKAILKMVVRGFIGLYCARRSLGTLRARLRVYRHWIPLSSVDQYDATLCSWLGVATANLGALFSNLANFNTKNLDFLG